MAIYGRYTKTMTITEIVQLLETHSNGYRLIFDRKSKFLQIDTRMGNCVYTGFFTDLSEEELTGEIIPELQEEE